MAEPTLRRERSPFALTQGGPFYRVMTRVGLRTPTSVKRCWWLALLVWLPLAIGAAIQHLLGAPRDPALSDLSLHARLLFTLPILLVGERLLDQTTTSGMTSLYRGDFCDHARLDDIVERGERLRDSAKVELALLTAAILSGQLVLWGVLGPTGVFHGETAAGVFSFPRVWYALVALPLVQFVMLRWVWRWLIWSYMIVRISKLPLSLIATHADFACGLTGLARPVTGFCGFVLATSAILSAAWGTQVLEDRTTVQALLPMLATFLVAALLIAVGPLLFLSKHLFRARRRTLAQYGDFMRAYTLKFHAKWIVPAGIPERTLGSPDIQSLNDLGEAFQVISKTRPFVFGPRTVLAVWSSGLFPMIPLFASTLTVEQVLKRIVTTVLGGMPL